MRPLAHLKPRQGFTLIELLVVILVIAVLMAVAAPSFLGQTQKAYDSTAKQYLTIGYKAAKADAVWTNDGSFNDAATVADAIMESEPQMDASAGSCPDDASADDLSSVIVDEDMTGGDTLVLCNNHSDRVYTLSVDEAHLSPAIETSIVAPVVPEVPEPAAATAEDLANATQVQTGGVFSCARTSTGKARCWGKNWYGNLGNGTTGDSTAPVTVSGLSSVVQVSTSDAPFACALLSDGTVWCWGYGYYGQLGNGTRGGSANSSTPVQVSGISTATQIATGDQHACAILSDHSVKCWGRNQYGELGDGTQGDGNHVRTTPVSVVGVGGSGLLSDITAIDAGGSPDGPHTCAVLTDGTIKCWGGNGYGQLGDNTTTTSWTPVEVSGISTATQVSAGQSYSCARLSDSSVKCWGYNYEAQLGDGTITNRHVPVTVDGLTDVTQVASGTYHTCARLSGGSVKCWGLNNLSQLGDGVGDHGTPNRGFHTQDYSFSPVTVTGVTNATQVDVKVWCTTIRTSDNHVVRRGACDENWVVGDYP